MEAYVILATEDGVTTVWEKAYHTYEEANAALNEFLESFDEDTTYDEEVWRSNQLRLVFSEDDSYTIYKVEL